MKRGQPIEEMVRIVREAEGLLAQGQPVEEVCRQLGLSQSTLVRWRQRYGGLTSPEAKRLRELEKENADLKHIVADLELAKRVLQEAVKRLGKV